MQTYAEKDTPLLWGPEWVVYGFPFSGYFFELKILESLSPAEAAQGRAMKNPRCFRCFDFENQRQKAHSLAVEAEVG